MIYTRKQFKQWAAVVFEPSVLFPNHPMWCVETDLKLKMRHFVAVLPVDHQILSETHRWASASLSGKYLCYYSNQEDGFEWWGFETHSDALVWLLRTGGPKMDPIRYGKTETIS